MAELPAFAFGTQYYRPPNPPRTDWWRDLARVRQHGMNTVKFWASWSWMHRARGQVEFDELDELMELAAASGLAVVLNTILENAPYWLEREAPHTRYVAHDGQSVQLTGAINTPGGGWPGLCFDNGEARSAASEFLTTVVERYHGHTALAGWDVWNEPHVEPTWYFPDKFFCYCDASISAFRHWLESRYGTIDAINDAWARRYGSWEEISPPRVFETYPDYLDWREYWYENLREWLEWRASVVRSVDSGHPVMTHVASSAYLGTLTANGWDEWMLAEPVDVFGTSSFPLWLMNDDPIVHLFHLEMTRDAADGKPWWQTELQGGRGRREGWRSTPHPEPRHITLWIWSAVAAGATGVLFWQWRPELLGPESPGYGLCTPAGEPTERTRVAAEAFELLAQFPELGDSRPVLPETAILVSRMTPLLAHASERTMDLYAQSLLGAYRAHVNASVTVRFVHEDAIVRTGVPEDVTRLYWPMPMYASPALADALARFVSSGGTVIAEASPGAYTDGGWYSANLPGSGLGELFGLEIVESDVAEGPVIETAAGRFAGAWSVDRVTTTTGTVEGTFTDGSPAVVSTRGKGVTAYIATYPSLAYERTRDSQAGAWIASAGSAHIPRDMDRPTPLIRLHRGGDVEILVAVNPHDDVTRASLEGRVTRATLGIRSVADMIEIELEPFSGAIATVRDARLSTLDVCPSSA